MTSVQHPTLKETRVSGEVEVLLLTCMDYRIIEYVRQYMTGLWLYRKYDHIVLAGASLGAVTDKYPAWNQTFWDHLALSTTLHGIRRVMVIDHRDCGFYKAITGVNLVEDPKRETDVHSRCLKTLRGMIRKKYPALEVELLLMGLHGVVEPVDADEAPAFLR